MAIISPPRVFQSPARPLPASTLQMCHWSPYTEFVALSSDSGDCEREIPRFEVFNGSVSRSLVFLVEKSVGIDIQMSTESLRLSESHNLSSCFLHQESDIVPGDYMSTCSPACVLTDEGRVGCDIQDSDWVALPDVNAESCEKKK